MGKEEAEVGVQAAEVKVVQADAQADLDVALPALEKALKALDSLTKNDITEVKGFAKPPPAVQIVMEAVCILLEVSERVGGVCDQTHPSTKRPFPPPENKVPNCCFICGVPSSLLCMRTGRHGLAEQESNNH